LAALAGGGGLDRPTVVRAFAAMREFEMPVQHRIGDYLADKASVRLVGPKATGKADRHPTFSFLHKSLPSDQVVAAVNGPKIGVRYGHMYAARLCEALGAPLATGFVRVSAVHYNTLQEADSLIEALERVL
jgi:selenocysteine lyase/cysteine desulfurase